MTATKLSDLNAESLEATDKDVLHRFRPTRKQLFTAGALASALLAVNRRASADPDPKDPADPAENPDDPRYNPDNSGETYDPAESWTIPELRLARRVTMGINDAEVYRARELGYEGYLEYQLDYAAIDDRAVENEVAQRYYLLASSPYDLQRLNQGSLSRDQLIEATIYRSVYSNRQLYERMVEFWEDHFSVFVDSAGVQVLKSADNRDVIRRHALGFFPEMLRESARSPAMLRYLDNYNSRADGGRRPNENYARELLELHTLGVDGGYTQEDVIEVAHVFTGWSFQTATSRTDYGTFLYRPEYHSTRNKTVLGNTITGRSGQAGMQEGEDVLGILIYHPSTAQYLAQKMSRWLLQYDPPQAVVDSVAQTYTSTAGDIKSMIRTILQPDNLMNAPAKFKRPYHLLVSAVRATNPTVTGSAAFLSALRSQTIALGQRPHYWATPDGYPDNVNHWGSLILPRWNFGFALTNNNVSGATVTIADLQGRSAQEIADGLDAALFGGEMPPGEKDALIAFLGAGAPPAQRIRDAFGLALASPNFQWY
jgi:uncharacterized protein (DUF1800 family)